MANDERQLITLAEHLPVDEQFVQFSESLDALKLILEQKKMTMQSLATQVDVKSECCKELIEVAVKIRTLLISDADALLMFDHSMVIYFKDARWKGRLNKLVDEVEWAMFPLKKEIDFRRVHFNLLLEDLETTFREMSYDSSMYRAHDLAENYLSFRHLLLEAGPYYAQEAQALDEFMSSYFKPPRWNYRFKFVGEELTTFVKTQLPAIHVPDGLNTAILELCYSSVGGNEIIVGPRPNLPKPESRLGLGPTKPVADTTHDINPLWYFQAIVAVTLALASLLAFILALIALNAATAGLSTVVIALGSMFILQSTPLILGTTTASVGVLSAGLSYASSPTCFFTPKKKEDDTLSSVSAVKTAKI